MQNGDMYETVVEEMSSCKLHGLYKLFVPRNGIQAAKLEFNEFNPGWSKERSQLELVVL